ncbi:secretion-regulating guanine nucleotide exchange factor isoform X6 [Perognathus longimembris pacificus]|uniref:secretion-regulating guanine nucleotide exchange factor isoform X6 n=1 Tax=Perognathus longimembris pacificus TaxID=214514 RepID=UPI0020198BEB|nr:secretion-regulating guanine nucleotide exchange factor isoform X6 [Perognathus longimembris pacificus]
MERQPCAPAAAPAAAALFSWGANSYGQLGLGHKEDVLLPQQLKDFCKPGCVRRITGGGGHSAVVTDEGGFFVCGLNKDGQLGLGHTEDVLCFTLCKYLLGCPVQQVACGWDFTIILTDLGNSKATHVLAGSDHSASLTDAGELYVWGRNKHGQLATQAAFLPLPQKIEAHWFQNEKVTAVWSGWTHLVAQTESGKVFTWGRADYGQLGRKLESNEGQKLEKQDPSFCLLPLNSTPSSLHCLTGAAEISCGSEHNLAVIGGACYSWGWNEHGMCGDGTEVNVWIPKPVQGLPSASGLLVGCGAGHSLALCQLPAHTALGQECQVTYPSPDATKDTGSQVAMDKERSCKKRQSGSPTQSPSDRSRNGEL